MNEYKLESRFNVKRFLLILSTILLISYGIFNSRNLIFGPKIEMINPTRDTESTEAIINVKGKITNAVFVSLNGKPIFINKQGIFEEKLLLSPGPNLIEIDAKDRFKKETSKKLSIYYKGTSTSMLE